MSGLPPSIRRRVRPVDRGGRLLRRVKLVFDSLVDARRKTLSSHGLAQYDSVWTVEKFRALFYWLAIGAKFQASVCDLAGWFEIDRNRWQNFTVPRLDDTAATLRLEELGGILSSYETVTAPGISLHWEWSKPGFTRLVCKLVDSAEFDELAKARSSLGRMEALSMRLERLGRAVKATVSRPGFRMIADAVAGPLDLVESPSGLGKWADLLSYASSVMEGQLNYCPAILPMWSGRAAVAKMSLGPGNPSTRPLDSKEADEFARWRGSLDGMPDEPLPLAALPTATSLRQMNPDLEWPKSRRSSLDYVLEIPTYFPNPEGSTIPGGYSRQLFSDEVNLED